MSAIAVPQSPTSIVHQAVPSPFSGKVENTSGWSPINQKKKKCCTFWSACVDCFPMLRLVYDGPRIINLLYYFYIL